MKIEPVDRQGSFTGTRISLRPVEDGDAQLISRFANDQRVAHMTTNLPFPMSDEVAHEFIEDALAPARERDVWVIDGSISQQAPFLGLMTLDDLDRGQSEVGYWVAPDFWNRGYASEALATLIAANPHANASIVAAVFQDNPASARVLAANGFMHLGAAEAYCPSRGCHVPSWTYLRNLSDAAARKIA